VMVIACAQTTSMMVTTARGGRTSAQMLTASVCRQNPRSAMGINVMGRMATVSRDTVLTGKDAHPWIKQANQVTTAITTTIVKARHACAPGARNGGLMVGSVQTGKR